MATIRKRTLPSGTQVWQADYRDAAGKRRSKQFDLKKDADAFMVRARHEVGEGLHIPDSQAVTIGEAAKLWLKTVDETGLERSTAAQYRQHVDLHIKPLIGALPVSKLTVAAVRAWEDQLRKDGRSAALVKKVRVSLGALLGDAMDRGLATRNVIRERGRSKSKGKDRRAEKRKEGKLEIGVDIPTREEIKTFLAKLEGRWRPLLLTAVFSGLRASELRGLRWSDINLAAGTLTVSQRADRYNEIGAPKSESGWRTIPIPPALVDALKAWKTTCPKGDQGLVFPTGAGNVESLANIRRRGLIPTWERAGVVVPSGEVDDMGVPILRAKYEGLHSLRHFYASWLINRKADGGLELPPKTVQARMGHSSIMVTLDTYSHLFPSTDTGAEMESAAMDLLA